MKKNRVLQYVTVIAILILSALSARAEYEHIIYFKTFIRVQTDGSILVNEQITVYADLMDIKRGIYRTLPTKSKDKYGNTFRTRYEILDVQKDGFEEAWHTEKSSGELTLYIGQEDVFLKPGIYTYSISYRADRQVGFFENYDEIYWNATGNQWAFRIDSAETIIKLPVGAEIRNYKAYTGTLGQKGSNYDTYTDKEGNLHFVTLFPLAPYEGITVAVSFQKGVVLEPSGNQKFMYILQDNLGSAIALVLLIIITLYFLFAWFKVGKDPSKGAIMVHYFPPNDLSPAATRYIMRMGFDNKSFAAALVNMAVKGYINISQENREYTLTPTEKGDDILSEDEKELASYLFPSARPVVLQNSNHALISSSINALKRFLKKKYEKIYFFRNTTWWLPGLLMSIAAFLAIIFTSDELGISAGMTIWVVMWGFGTIAIISNMVKAWKNKSRTGSSVASKIILTIVFVPFIIVFFVAVILFSVFISLLPVCILVLIVAVDALFYYLLKAPTVTGRKVMDNIEGFKEFLNVAEKDELNLRNPPEKTPELFEKYLPYAIALGVENRWGERFTSILASAVQNGSYSPSWYTSSSFHTFSTVAFVSGLSTSFSSAVSSSATAPSSRSGSGGGGFSGGGGGGGGGGGW